MQIKKMIVQKLQLETGAQVIFIAGTNYLGGGPAERREEGRSARSAVRGVRGAGGKQGEPETHRGGLAGIKKFMKKSTP